jgi:hypothetical protein
METTMMYEAWGWPQWIIAGVHLANLVVLVSKETETDRLFKVSFSVLVILTLYMGGFWDA